METRNIEAKVKENNLKKALAECANHKLMVDAIEREENNKLHIEKMTHPSEFKTCVTMNVVDFLSDYIDWDYVSRFVPMTKNFINTNIENINIYSMIGCNPHIDKGWVRDILNGVGSDIRNAAVSLIYNLFYNGVIDRETVIKYGDITDIHSMNKLIERSKGKPFAHGLML